MKRSKIREVGVHIEPHNVALAVRGEDLDRVADAAALRNGDIRDNSRDCRSLSLLADHPSPSNMTDALVGPARSHGIRLYAYSYRLIISCA